MNQTKQSSSSTMVLVAILMLLIGGAIGYYMTKTYYPTKETVTVEVPAAEETTNTSIDEEELKKEVCEQLYPESNNSLMLDEQTKTDFSCTVNKITENHAEGGAANHPWFAAKINGKWTEVFGTQDTLPCYILWQYDFPKDIWNTCFDPESKKNVTFNNETADLSAENVDSSNQSQVIDELLQQLYPDCVKSSDEAKVGQCIFKPNLLSENYASGLINEKLSGNIDQIVRKYWYAVKINGKWKNVYEINSGTSPNSCLIYWQYNFPTDKWKPCSSENGLHYYIGSE